MLTAYLLMALKPASVPCILRGVSCWTLELCLVLSVSEHYHHVPVCDCVGFDEELVCQS